AWSPRAHWPTPSVATPPPACTSSATQSRRANSPTPCSRGHGWDSGCDRGGVGATPVAASPVPHRHMPLISLVHRTPTCPGRLHDTLSCFPHRPAPGHTSCSRRAQNFASWVTLPASLLATIEMTCAIVISEVTAAPASTSSERSCEYREGEGYP